MRLVKPWKTVNPAVRARLARLLPPLLFLGAAIGVWYVVSTVVLDPERQFLFPPPHDVVRVGYLDGDNRAELLDGLWHSAEVASLGLGAATAAGLLLAVLMSQARWLERSLFPYLVVLQATPILALVPLFGFWFEYGFGTRVLVCALIALFPVVASTLFGLRSVDGAHHDLFTLHGAGRAVRLWKLQLPAALPSIFTGLRISAGLSVIGAIVGDFFFRQGEPGIGVLIDRYQSRLQSEQLLAAVILSSLFGLAVFWLFGALARWVVGGWHESAREPGAL
ncbi:ABC transporter permease [Streptomyces sp. NPDC051940]|uniref:ABC transporter permease n=1 Tax=Streptomyces sp. NPDC051940 TaxID=3155675 RepID=UPI003425907D